MKRLACLFLLVLTAQFASAQFTFTTSNTVQMPNATRPWIDMADPTCFGNGQIFKQLFYCDSSDFPQLYNQNSWTANVGGSGGTPTTTSWPNQATGGSGTTSSYSASGGVVTLTGTYSGLFAGQFVQFAGFTSATYLNGGSAFLTSASGTTLVFNWSNAPNTFSLSDTGGVYLGYVPNYFVGATFVAKNSATGATYGTGTITASTATTSTNGVVFTLSPALSSVPVNNDVLIVMLRTPAQRMTPFQLFGRTGASLSGNCAGAVFNTSDTAPGSSNTTQSLELPTGCTLTLFADQTQRNATNPNQTLAAASVNHINVNGSYTQSLKYKCSASSGSVSITYGLVRANGGQTFVPNTTVTPACNSGNGLGLTTISNPVTGTETGTQNGNIAYTLACTTGPCRFNDADFTEGSTLTGNTTVFRDDVVRTIKGQTGILQGLNPGGIRWMAPPQWCTYQAQEWAAVGNRARCNVSNFIPYSFEATMGYDDMLSLCDVAHISCYISVGMFNQPSDWATLITTLTSNAHYINIKNAGNKVFLANGNEAFNSAAGGSLYEGDGVLYGSVFGPNFASARGASGFDATHIKLVGNSWFAPGQSDGTFGWFSQMVQTANSISGTAGLPDFAEIAPYNFSNLNNCSVANTSCLTSGLTSSGEPWTGLFSQIPSFDIVLPRPSGEGSVIASVQTPPTVGTPYAGIQTMVYEMNSGLISGLAASQDQIDSVAAGVGESVALGLHWEMMQQGSGVTGPLGTFILTEGFNGFNCSGGGCPSNLVSPVWGVMRTMPCGPGQLSTCLPQFRPQGIIMQQVNRAIGSNSNLMASTTSCSGGAGTCYYNYAGGQPSGSTNTIPANTQVNFVNCFQRSLANAQTVDCYNSDASNSHTVTIAGPVAPTSTVSQSVFPVSGQTIVSHNEASYIGTLGTTPTVTLPAVTSTSGVTYTLPPASLTSLNFSTGNNWYVRKGATGTGAGTSWTNAWTDFSSINYSSVACGDTVWIAGNSTYTTNFTWNKTCTSGNPLTFKGVLASDAVPVASPGWSAAFDVSVNPAHAINSAVSLCCAFVTIDGRVGDAQSQTPYGLQFSYTTDGWTAAWNTSTSQNTDDFIMSHIEVVGPACTVSPNPVCTNSNWGVNICCVKANTNFTIDHSWIHQWPEVVRPYQSTNLTIQYSYIGEDARLTTGDHEDLVYASDPVTNFVVHDTTLYESGNDGVFFDNACCSGATFYNDIFFHNAGWQISFGKTGTCGPYKVYTSIFESDGTNGEYNYAWLGTGGCTVASGTDMKDNIFYNTVADASSSGPGIDSTQSYMSGTVANGVSFPTGCTGCSSYSPASPLTSFTGWVNMLATPVVASDFHLTPSGVTLFQNKGLNLTSTVCTTIPGVCTDRDGNTRPTTGNWTLGPYQTASTPTLAAPTFSPVAGTYPTTQNVAISGPGGATLCFTTDGSTPTASPVGTCSHGTPYATPVSVPSNLTINAIATETGFFNSAVASAAYVIAPPAATPTFSPAAGTYTSVQTVTISTTTPSPTIHYTTDGTTPTLTSPTYAGPITVSVSETVKAIAIASGFSTSPVGTVAYVINLPNAAPPTFSPVAGTYPTAQSVALATTTSGGVICTKIGSAPSATVAGTCDPGSTPYSTAISVTTSQTIFALTTKAGLINSSVVSSAYIIEVPASTPTFSPVAGTYTSVQTVALSTTTPAATIHYSFNNTLFFTYTAPLSVSTSQTIYAYATASGFTQSATVSAAYVINLPAAATPTFTPPAGTYTSVQNVALASTTAGASIFYTTDGSTPTPASTPYTTPISVSTTQTIKAIATASGFSNSAIGTAAYVITLPPVATPTFAPPAGPYSSSQSVVISSTTAGASIYYTTDGSTPTPRSTLYTGPITVSASQTIKAIGVLTGFSNSLVGSAAYTITSTTPGCTVRGNVTIRGTVTIKCPQ